MLRAIAGSMMRAGGVTMLSAASDSVMLCAIVNAVTMTASCRMRSAEQQQPDQKQQVIRPDQDVVHAGRHEPADDGKGALRRPGVVLEPCAATVEDGLRERLALVHVEECLMVRIVRKEQRVDGHDARRGSRDGC